MADDAPFLSRWSQRKALARQGRPLAEPPPPPSPPPAPAVAKAPVAVAAPQGAPAAPPDATPAVTPTVTQVAPPAPTLDDVARLPSDASDFSRFVARDVQPEVKNAALKKLFSDPHFNVMDGLDIYIDDYSKPDPLPASMLRQMVQSRFLGLFDDEEQDGDKTEASTGAVTGAKAAAQAAAEPAPEACDTTAAALHEPPADPVPAHAPAALPHEDADLRLQPHPAAGPEGAAAGAEPAPGRQH